MIIEPRFLILDDTIYLMAVTYSRGTITAIQGPYQCKGMAGESAEQLAQGLTTALHKALHAEKVLELGDLPEEIQNQIQESLASEGSPSVSEVEDAK